MGTRRLSLREKLTIRPAPRCDCDDLCYFCEDFGHSACWRRVALWRRIWILWQERKA